MTLSDTLKTIRELYRIEQDNVWLILTVIIMSTLNHPEDIPHVYALLEKDIDASDVQDKDTAKAIMVLRLREAILKSFVVAGFPKAINGLQQLALATPANILAKMSTIPRRNEDKWEDIVTGRQQGRDLFAKIYDRHTERVLGQMHDSYPDLSQTALHHIYPVLSDTRVVNARDTSLIMVAALYALQLPAQLRGHSYGALHNGASRDDITRVYKLVSLLLSHYGPLHLSSSKL